MTDSNCSTLYIKQFNRSKKTKKNL